MPLKVKYYYYSSTLSITKVIFNNDIFNESAEALSEPFDAKRIEDLVELGNSSPGKPIKSKIIMHFCLLFS